MVNVWSMTNKCFCVKKTFFAINALFSKIMSQSNDLFWLIQAQIYPSTYLEMEELQLMLLEKQLRTKSFFYFGAKRQFIHSSCIIKMSISFSSSSLLK